MEKIIRNICDLTIENYMTANEILKYGGIYINHFAGILYSGHKKKINCDRVKEIRKYIKNKTSRMSSFRGDILYILSLLIGVNKSEWKSFADKVICNYEMLIEEKFEEGPFLVLPSYALAKHVEDGKREEVILRIKDNYKLLKEKNDNVTNGEDYLICALLAIKSIGTDKIESYMDYVDDCIEGDNILSNNEIQGLTTSMSLNFKDSLAYDINTLLEELERRDIRISNKFLHILGVMKYDESAKSYVDRIECVVRYLCEEEASYEFYMDKSFRTVIAISIVEEWNNLNTLKFMDELIAFGIYSFLISKNQDVFARGLA